MPDSFHLGLIEQNGVVIGEGLILDNYLPGLNILTKDGDINQREKWGDVARLLLDRLYMLTDGAGRIYIYNKGKYHVDHSNMALSCIITSYCAAYNSKACKMDELCSPSNKAKIIDYIKNQVGTISLEPSKNKICFLNGTYHILKGAFLPHSPRDRMIIQIPHKFDPMAKGTKWNERIKQWVKPDCVPVMWKLMALAMIPFTGAQTAIFLLGGGSNGKSMFLRYLEHLLGEENCGTLSFKQLSDTFAPSHLVGKLVNICNETTIGRIEDTATYKAIISGDDILFQEKYAKPIRVKPYSRFFMGANELPSSADTSEGFFRRQAIIRFPNHFENSSAESAQIKRDMTSPYEVSSAINMALGVLPDMVKEHIKPTPSMQEEMALFMDREIPEKRFLDDTLKDGDSSDRVPKAEIYDRFKEYCELHGCRCSSREYFWKLCIHLHPNWKTLKVRLPVGGFEYMLFGVTWKEQEIAYRIGSIEEEIGGGQIEDLLADRFDLNVGEDSLPNGRDLGEFNVLDVEMDETQIAADIAKEINDNLPIEGTTLDDKVEIIAREQAASVKKASSDNNGIVEMDGLL